MDLYIGIDLSITSTSICLMPRDKPQNRNFIVFSRHDTITKKRKEFNDVLAACKIDVVNIQRIKSTSEYDTNEQAKLSDICVLIDSIISFISKSASTNNPMIAIEGISYSSKGNRSLDIAQYHGALKYALSVLYPIQNIHVVPPKTLKKFSSGSGNADKEYMINNYLNKSNEAWTTMLSTNKQTLISTTNKTWKKPIDDVIDSASLVDYLLSMTN